MTQALDEARVRRLQARRRHGSPPTTSMPRSRCSGPCCCRATPPRRPSNSAPARTSTSRPTPTSSGRSLAVRPGGAGRPGDGGRRAAPVRAARGRGRPVDAHLAAGQHAVDGQRLLLRPDRRGARPAPAARSPWPARSPSSATASPRTSPRWSTGPSRWSSRWPSGGWSTRCRRLRDLLGREPRPARGAGRAGRDDHRRAHRLPRPRRPAGRAADGQPGRRGGPARPWARRASPSAS